MTLAREDRLYLLTEAFLAESLTAEERVELTALTADTALGREFTAQVRLSRALSTVMAPRSLAEAWPKVEGLLADDARRAEQMADRVVDELGTRRRVRPVHVASALLAVAAVVLVVGIVRRADPVVGPSVAPILTGAAAPPAVPLAPAGTLDAAAPPALEETGDVVFALDLGGPERGFLAGGRIARCPPGLGGVRCIEGERFSARFRQVVGMMAADHRDGLFDYDHDLLFTFDYWLGETTGPDDAVITGWFHDATQKTNYGIEEHHAVARAGVVRGRWAHRAIPLSAYRPHRGAGPPRPGDRITVFDITGRHNKEDVFFLANVKVVRGRRAAPPER